jgi:hypothetical protein
MSRSRRFGIVRWKIVTFSVGRSDCYHTRTFPQKDEAIGYVKGWTREDDAKNGYVGKGIIRQRTYEGNPNTVAIMRDGELVGVASPMYERVNINYGGDD